MVRVITLLTDFGLADVYAGVMKGVILRINPDARIVDLSHNVPPQSIHEAAFLLSTAYKYFPSGTIHLVVVDPGVGSKRRSVILKTPEALFVAPDNGVLSYILDDLAPLRASDQTTGLPNLAKRQLPLAAQGVIISNPDYWRQPVSDTFHGRDVFAPVVANLSLDVPIEEFGEVTDFLWAFPVPHPEVRLDGSVIGHVVHIDHFGNIITDVRVADLPHGQLSFDVADQRIKGLSHSYDAGD